LIFGWSLYNFSNGYPAWKTISRSPGAPSAGVSRM